MTSVFSATQEHYWRLALELKLRRLYGTAFQDFFSDLMQRRYSSDFVPTRPYGARGDKGCDGYLLSSGELFQCYGKVDDAAFNVASTTEKIVDDFGKAKTNFGQIMKHWRFVHNLIDGVPSEVITTISNLTNGSAFQWGIAGREWFMDTMFALKEPDIVSFLGPAANVEDSYGLDVNEVKELLAGLTQGDEAPLDEGDPRPVPVDKLDFNHLNNDWRAFIRAGSPNSTHVKKYCDRHPNFEFEKLVARKFNDKYKELKAQQLEPDAIMAELFHRTAGEGIISPRRYIATQAVLAHVFDACDIFEDRPVGGVSQ